MLQRVSPLGFIEKRNERRPATGGAPFHAGEIFFSRTDQRGVILAANYIFQRVSGYDWNDLLGAPHKLIRHPDMPKGVFWLFWDSLKRGEPVGAYVKNRARDGLYYWVYAVAMPFQDGYLSVRIKPSSDLLRVIEKEYETLRATEIEDGISSEESADILLQRLQALGYADYPEFASDALAQELASRDSALGNPQNPATEQFENMIVAAVALQDETVALSAGFDAVSTVPTNMRIIAARLEPSGGAVSSLAQNYWEMSEEMQRWFQDYINNTNSDFTAIRRTLDTSRFLCGTARILTETAAIFSKERRALGRTDTGLEKHQINDLAAQFASKAKAGLQHIEDEAHRILQAIDMMRRFTLGLSSTRVMCNIESARLPNGGGSLVDVINQLGVFQGNLMRQLEQIEAQSHLIEEYAQALISNKGGTLPRPEFGMQSKKQG